MHKRIAFFLFMYAVMVINFQLGLWAGAAVALYWGLTTDHWMRKDRSIWA